MKPAPGDRESYFKKVGSILCWFNTIGTEIYIWIEKTSFRSKYLEINSIPIKFHKFLCIESTKVVHKNVKKVKKFNDFISL